MPFKAELIAALQRLLMEKGRLTRRLIDESRTTPTAITYCKWFGSLAVAYDLAGYRPKGFQKTLMEMHGRREGHGWVVQNVRHAPSAKSSRLRRA